MYLIEGTIADFEMALGRVNLLKNLKVGSTQQNLAAGIVGVVGGMPALAANVAMLESYEGDSAVYFGCRVGEQVVIGQFAGAELLNDGDEVKVVVEQQDDVLYAHAVQRPKDGLLWLPVGENMGIWAAFMSQMRFASWTFILIITFIFIVLVFLSAPIKAYYLFAAIGFLAAFPMGIWAFFDLRSLAEEAEKIFKVLGFPKASQLDMRDGSYAIHHGDYSGDAQSIYYYQCVLEAYRTGEKVRIDVPSRSDERIRKEVEYRKNNPNYQAELDEAKKYFKQEWKARRAAEKKAKGNAKNSNNGNT